jgi:alpha-L-fucosidase
MKDGIKDMNSFHVSRRDMLLGTGASLLSLGADGVSQTTAATQKTPAAPHNPLPGPPTADQIRRLEWWRAARFGMFIHFGLYSQYARQEWAMEKEAIPIPDYQELTKQFHPKPGAQRAWARLAKAAGMKYMVMTAKHHEGFCNFDTKLTDYNAVQQGPKRDLVREYVEAARAQGLRVGIYYSLMDWHHPDGSLCATDEAARKRFIEYTHGLIRELMTNYGKIDILWYDGGMPLDAKGWEPERMNKMVFELQPDIVVNNRNLIPGDFSTPEQRIVAAANGAAWESCMTLNESWGYDSADDEWKSSGTIVRNLIKCASGGGNYLLNIGPKGDGSIPPESVRILTEVGQWLNTNGNTIYKSEHCQPWRPSYASFTRIGNTLFMHVYFWPGGDVSLSGLTAKVKSAHFNKNKQEIKFTQDTYRVHLTGLPMEAPDSPATTIVLECDSEPIQILDPVLRAGKPRGGVGMEP